MATNAFMITSDAFSEGKAIPTEFTCDGQNVSPKITFQQVPANTKSLALICDDPDAPRAQPFVHWVIYNIKPDMLYLAQGLQKSAELPNGIQQGINDANQPGYYGPCPPAGKAHRYLFTCYALDTIIPVEPGMKKNRLLQLMQKHIIAQTQLMGTYQRK